MNKALTKERRTEKFSVDIEPSLAALMDCVTEEQHISRASYVRAVIIKDLDSRGLITKEALLRIVV